MKRLSLIGSSLAVLPLIGTPAEPLPAGVVVEGVGVGLPADTAGLRAGDVLVSWRVPDREGLGGPLDSPFDLDYVETEVAPRGGVVLVGERAGLPLEVRVEGGQWLVRSRPVLGGPDDAAFRRGESLARDGRVDDAVAAWRELAEAAAARGDGALACWLAVRVIERGPPGPAAELSELEALSADICASAGRAERIALAHQALARAWQARHRHGDAEAAWREALRLWEDVAPRSLGAASAWQGLGSVFWDRGLPNEAEPHLRRALSLREELAPEALEVAATQELLGRVAGWQSQHEGGVAEITRAAEIRKRLAPRSLLAAESLLNLAIAHRNKGDHQPFRTLAQEALSSASRIEPDGLLVGTIQIEMGITAFARGDLLIAEGHYRRALAIAEKLAPQGRLTARALNNLGIIAGARGDLGAAETYLERAMTLFRLHWPDALITAGVLANYANSLAEQGRFEDAERIYDEAIAVGERAGPGSNTFLFILVSAARTSQRRGDQARFEQYAMRTVELMGRLGRHLTGDAHGIRAELALSRGDLVDAERWIREEIALTSRFFRADALHAVAYRRLARLHQRRGNKAEAAEAYRRAVDALESVRGRLGGSGSDRLGFGVRHAQLYHEAIEALLEVGRPAEAFQCLERSRARSLLEMMSARDLALDSDLPPELQERKRSLDAEYERTQRESLDAVDEERQDELADRLEQLDRQRKDVAKEARRISPRLATIVDPQPVDVGQARETLDSGTAFLAYSVGPERTVLFVLAPHRAFEPAKDVEAVVIPLGSAALRQRIAAWRRMAERTAPPPAFFAEGRALYDQLIGPVEPLVAPAARLVVSADGPLHHLPFAALRRRGTYLAEWKPLSLVPSASVLEQLVLARPAAPAAASLVAFGDPEAPGLPSLAGSRREVAALQRLFPRAQVFLGAEASKPRMQAVAGRYRYVHFAGHGLLEERLPLESALGLSPGPGASDLDDGRLRVWEVFERLRLDADLLTLSACRSAAGTEAAGEGMLGLTRAFHYAGARSVVASLWRVPDQSTPQFMSWFYGALKEGLPKDQALRGAQRAAIRAGHHPLRWASFQLYGDWR